MRESRSAARLALVAAGLCVGGAHAAVFAWEADVLPQEGGWAIEQIWCDPPLWVKDGWFYQDLRLCPGWQPPSGQVAAYRRSLADFDGAASFFLEWQVDTTAPRSELPWGGGAAISLDGSGGIAYLTFIARDQAKLFRDRGQRIVFVDITPGDLHSYRVEILGHTVYQWIIDGRIVESGVPGGHYPAFNPTVVWVAKSSHAPNVTRWDYIRYGHIDSFLSGDTNCDGAVNFNDIESFVSALVDREAYSAAHLGCRWHNADVSGDGWVDFDDIEPFIDCLIADACP